MNRPNLGERLRAAPHRFDALHALRMLELGTARLGTEARPPEEPMRIVAEQGLALSPSPLRRVAATVGNQVLIAFMGLTGPLGVLPQFYTEIVQQAARQRNRGMAAFLDVFNHRLAGLFLRAGDKYRLPVLMQRRLAAPDAAATDPVTETLFALIGLGTPRLRNRMAVRDEVLLYYAGLFAMRGRPASCLQAIVADYLGTAVQIEQFSGRWTALAADEQTRMPRAGETPAFCRLGVDAVAGGRVWDVQGHFRVVVGPIGYAQMLALSPGSPQLAGLIDLVRAYAGPDLAFDIQLVLRRDDVPDFRFDPAPGETAPRLGWNSWAKSLPALADSRDIIIDPDYISAPNRSPARILEQA